MNELQCKRCETQFYDESEMYDDHCLDCDEIVYRTESTYNGYNIADTHIIGWYSDGEIVKVDSKVGRLIAVTKNEALKYIILDDDGNAEGWRHFELMYQRVV